MTVSRITQLEYIRDTARQTINLDMVIVDVARLYAGRFMNYADARDTIAFFADEVFQAAVNDAENEKAHS